jgi:Integrase core domain
VVRLRKPPSQTWRTFLDNHLQTLVSVDFFVVPTVLFKVLFVFVVLAHERRRVLHINVTDTPTAQWTAQQLVEAFPWETAPRYVLRDRDAAYGVAFSSRVQTMGIHEVKTAPRSPWQNPYVERLIGTLRRECLDHGVPRMPNREGRQCCGRDEGRPLGVGVQDQAPNPLTLRWSRASVVNGEEKAR